MKSTDPFEILFLDRSLADYITRSMVETHYNLLDDFWRRKLSEMEMGANRFLIVRKFAGERGSQADIAAYQKAVQEAHARLLSTGIVETARELEQEAFNLLKRSLIPHLEQVIDKDELQPSAERGAWSLARKVSPDVPDQTIQKIFDTWLSENGYRRGRGGSGGTEDLVFYNIKKMLADTSDSGKLLTRGEEEDLRTQVSIAKLSNERFEQLLLQAFREVKDSERESTVEEDKRRFREFYWCLLKDHGLNSHGDLPIEAREKLHLRDCSETEFFPLSQATRMGLIRNTVTEYKKALEEERKQFSKTAAKALLRFDGHADRKKALLEDGSYRLLLPNTRLELLDEEKRKVLEAQRDSFRSACWQNIKKHFWKTADEEWEKIVVFPEGVFGKDLKTDWLDAEERQTIISAARSLGVAEYQKELQAFKEMLQNGHKSNRYGLPPDRQLVAESDEDLSLDLEDRRRIIIDLERNLRKAAEEQFRKTVKKKLVHGSLIPEIEAELQNLGETEFLLTDEKNRMTVTIPTAPEIIQAFRRPFPMVVREFVSEVAQGRTVTEQLVKQYKLNFRANIAKADFEALAEGFKPAGPAQRKTVLSEMGRAAEHEKLNVVAGEPRAEFTGLLEELVWNRSKQYRLSLRSWLTDTFLSDMIHIGAAYGVTKADVDARVEEVKVAYPMWTLPRWKTTGIWMASVTAGLAAIRVLISLTGYGDWLFLSGPVQAYELKVTGQVKEFSYFLELSRTGYWVLVPLIVIVVVILLASRKKK